MENCDAGGSSGATTRDLSISYAFGGTRDAPRVRGVVPCVYDPAGGRPLKEVLLDRTNLYLSAMCALFDAREADATDPARVEDMAGAIAQATQALFKEPSGKYGPVLERALRLRQAVPATATALLKFVDQQIEALDLLDAAYTHTVEASDHDDPDDHDDDRDHGFGQ